MTDLINPFAEQWLQALESDTYQQGIDFLCHEGKFCCLGVAEDLAGTPYYVTEGGTRHYGEAENAEGLTEATQIKLNLKSWLGEASSKFIIRKKFLTIW